MMIELALKILGWWLAITLVGSFLSAIVYPLVSQRIQACGPSLRSFFRLFYAGLAPVAALAALVLVTQPTLAGLIIPAHCHGSNCGTHTPVYAMDSLLLIGLAGLSSLVVLVLLGVLFWAIHQGQRRLRLLRAFARSSGKGYSTLDSEDVLVCCVGLWRSQILVSRGLLEQLDSDELEVVLAHERAHALRLDNMRAFLLGWLVVFWPASLAERVRWDSRADAEQVCDSAAAKTALSPMHVAAVIRKLSLLSSGTSTIQTHRSVGFNCDDAAARIAVLESGVTVNTSLQAGWYKPFTLLAMGWCVQIYLLTAVSHQMIEWLGAVII